MLEAVPYLGFTPDVIHANDWQTGLVPVFLNEAYRSKPAYRDVRSLFTIHNIAYQGMYGPEVMKLTGLPGWLLNPAQLEFHGHLNFLKAGVVFADAVNTVSPTYAREITTPDFGCGLDGLLRGVSHKLSGIVNGCDYADWDPSHDRHIAAKYTAATVAAVKAACKADLQKRYGLPQKPDVPVLGMVARLVSQKGVDLVLSAAPGSSTWGASWYSSATATPSTTTS